MPKFRVRTEKQAKATDKHDKDKCKPRHETKEPTRERLLSIKKPRP